MNMAPSRKHAPCWATQRRRSRGPLGESDLAGARRHVQQAGREADRALLEPLGDEPLHLRELGVRRRPVVGPHGDHAHGAVRDEHPEQLLQPEKEALLRHLNELQTKPLEQLMTARDQRLRGYGVYSVG